MPLVKPSKIDTSPLPINDEETGTPKIYRGRINGVPKVEKAPKGKFNPDGTKEQLVIVIDVLNAPESFVDKKIWARPEFKLSASPKAKKLTQLSRLIKAADSNYEIGEEYDTDELDGKELQFTLTENTDDQDRVWQKPAEYYPIPAGKKSTEKKSKGKKDDGEAIEY